MFVTQRRAGSRRSGSNGRGQSLAEFALVAPIFFLLVFAIIQLGLVFSAQNGLVDGVRNAARRAATYRVNELSMLDASIRADVCQAIEADLETRLSDLMPGYDSARLRRYIAYEWVLSSATDEYFLVSHIEAQYDNLLYVPLVSYFLDNSDGTVDEVLTLDASEQMRVENPTLEEPDSLSAVVCVDEVP